MDDYAPFPHRELEKLASYHEKAAQFYVKRDFQEAHRDRAKVCRDAIACYQALQERFGKTKLLAEHGISEENAA